MVDLWCQDDIGISTLLGEYTEQGKHQEMDNYSENFTSPFRLLPSTFSLLARCEPRLPHLPEGWPLSYPIWILSWPAEAESKRCKKAWSVSSAGTREHWRGPPDSAGRANGRASCPSQWFIPRLSFWSFEVNVFVYFWDTRVPWMSSSCHVKLQQNHMSIEYYSIFFIIESAERVSDGGPIPLWHCEYYSDILTF